jgi:hypothetical protein
MILRLVRPESRTLSRGQDDGQYDQHGEQGHVDKNAPAGCGRPPEQDQPKAEQLGASKDTLRRAVERG